MAAGAPRIRPGSRAEIGLVNYVIAQVVGAAAGGGPPNVMTTIARHRGLFRRWLPFAGALMPGGRLPRRDTELLILRVAHNSGCEYEWHHHEQIARLAGLEADDIARVREGAEAGGWSERRAALLRAADELYADRLISDEVWAELSPLLSDAELVEVCMLVGHYAMLAGTLNSLGVQLDEVPLGRPTRAMRLVQSIVNRRQRSNA